MRYLISYDIEPNAVRARIAKTMEAHGERVQKSVFECELERKERTRLIARLGKELESSVNGSIRIYRICAACEEESWVLGSAPDRLDDDSCIVFD